MTPSNRYLIIGTIWVSYKQFYCQTNVFRKTVGIFVVLPGQQVTKFFEHQPFLDKQLISLTYQYVTKIIYYILSLNIFTNVKIKSTKIKKNILDLFLIAIQTLTVVVKAKINKSFFKFYTNIVLFYKNKLSK